MAQTQTLPPPVETPSPEKMTFLEHLDELRRRIIHAVLSLLVAFVVCFYFSTEIFEFLMGPMRMALPPGGDLIATKVPEVFVLHLKMSFFAGIFLASPFWLSQVWLFISPGLYENEKKFAVPFILFGTFFFISGAVFAHYMVFPLAVRFFSTFGSPDVQIMLTVSEVFSFYAKVILAAGVMFQIPTIVFLLARIGLVSARFLWDNFKYAILIIFIIAAILTPPDVVTQCLLAGPMTALYLLSIAIAWLVGRERKPPGGE